MQKIDHTLFMAESIAQICEKLDIPWIYKSCYDKDCRPSPKSFHVGIDEGLKIFLKLEKYIKFRLFQIFQILHGLKQLAKFAT